MSAETASVLGTRIHCDVPFVVVHADRSLLEPTLLILRGTGPGGTEQLMDHVLVNSLDAMYMETLELVRGSVGNLTGLKVNKVISFYTPKITHSICRRDLEFELIIYSIRQPKWPTISGTDTEPRRHHNRYMPSKWGT